MSSPSPAKQRVLVIGLIAAGILFTAFFGARAFHIFRMFNGHRPPPPGKIETDVELIRDWMPIPYIAHMYDVPDKMLFDALAIPEKENRRKSLLDINKEYFPGKYGFVLTRVKQTIIAFQQKTPLPPLSPVPEVTPTVQAP